MSLPVFKPAARPYSGAHRRILMVLSVCAAGSFGSVATAEDKPESAASPASAGARREEGKRLFDKAIELTKAYRHFEGCELMEKSYALDASLSTKFWLARCKSTVGHLASASRIYQELLDTLAEQARSGGLSEDARSANESRQALVKADLEGVAGDVPSMRLEMPANLRETPGLSVKRNGAVVPRSEWEEAWPLDPGMYTIALSAPGYVSVSVAREVVNGKHIAVKLEPLVPSDVAPRSEPGAVQRALGWTSSALGVAALVAGNGLLIASKVEYDESISGCTEDMGCSEESRDSQQSATLKSDVGTGLVMGGVLTGLTGIALVVTAPLVGLKGGSPLAQVTVTPNGIQLRGRW